MRRDRPVRVSGHVCGSATGVTLYLFRAYLPSAWLRLRQRVRHVYVTRLRRKIHRIKFVRQSADGSIVYSVPLASGSAQTMKWVMGPKDPRVKTPSSLSHPVRGVMVFGGDPFVQETPDAEEE